MDWAGRAGQVGDMSGLGRSTLTRALDGDTGLWNCPGGPPVSPQSWFPGLLAGIGLLAAAASGRGQESPLPVITAPDSVGPAGPAAAPVPTPSWYAGAEVAVLFTAATHYNEHFFAVRGTPAEFLSPRLYLGYDLDGSGSVRFTYRNLTQVDYPDGPIPGWASGQSFTTNWIDLDYVSPEYAPTD